MDRYVKALEQARNFYPDNQFLDTIFPELAESEDERIRKELIEFIKHGHCTFDDYDQKFRFWAWLEKQKEPTHLELKAGRWYICYRAFCCRADHLTVQEGERFMCEKDGVAKGFVIKEPEKYFKECSAPAPMEEEQQPAEWSEEDDALLREIVSFFKYGTAKLQHDLDLYARFLEKKFKSLRPKPHWKPSEEQMVYLKEAINKFDFCDAENAGLQALYEQLKKL